MRKATLVGLICVLALGAGSSAQQGALQTAADTLGVAKIKTLQFTGSGENFSVGQNFTQRPVAAGVREELHGVDNYDTGSMRVELLREMGPVMPRGGGAPFFGEQRQIQVVERQLRVERASTAGANAPAGARLRQRPQPDAQLERMLALWSTPQGFVKAAMANNATTRAPAAEPRCRSPSAASTR